MQQKKKWGAVGGGSPPKNQVMGAEGSLDAQNICYEREVDLEEAKHPRGWMFYRITTTPVVFLNNSSFEA